MNSTLVCLPFVWLLISCSSTTQNIDVNPITIHDTEIVDTVEVFDSISIEEPPFPFENYGIVLIDSAPYSKRKQQAEQLRIQLKRAVELNEVSLDSVGTAFENFLIANIFPHWYGTPWDYEGHTNTPNDGEVACGYFVSTTIRHMNVQINRYHLAQQASSNGAKSLAVNFDNISTYRNIEDFEDKLENGLYTVGLSNHVGFLFKRNGKLFFIHSDYIDLEVKPELAADSEALNYSTIFVIVRVGNKELMQKWLNQETVKVYR